jgi:small conductance mechanosensitive channel
VGIENNQTVIYVVGNPARAIAQQTIATVTGTDATQAGISIPELAGRWRDRFRRAISDALWGIDFDRRHPFGRNLLVVGLVSMAVPLILVLLHLGRILDGIQRRVRRRQERLERMTRQEAMDALGVHSEERHRQSLASLQKPEVLRRAASLLHLLKRLVQIAIVATVLGVIVLGLAVFPVSRDLAVYLTGQFLILPLFWLALTVLQPLLALAVDQGLTRWGRSVELLDPDSNRHELRITTYSKVLHTGVTLLCLLVGLYGTVVLLGIDASVLAGAGLVAVAIGFLTRNLLEDILNGALILFTDRFAIGDVITVGDKGGLVEDMNLHITSLRGTDGQLTTIPNRRIDVVDNLTQRWSRVDFTVRVAAGADPRQALAVVEAEGQRFWQEPEWQELLMAPPDLLGIDEISHAGTLIRVWIATRPLKQWLVGRQFRLRIKLALEEAGIELGMPQQRVFLPEASPGALEPSP